MIVTLENGSRFDASSPIDISMPLRFDGPQPNAYGVEPASAKACEYGALIGDTRRGGSCNFEQYTFITHCSGTHTECVGHITHERISVPDCLKDVLIRATLITVIPVESSATEVHRPIAIRPGDKLITAESIRAVLSKSEPPALAGGRDSKFSNAELISSAAPPADAGGSDFALIVRTLPNDDGKLSRRYDASKMPPYFTSDAMQYIVELGFKHLLVDLPSIDRLFDGGRLANHRIFWGVEDGSFEINDQARINSTITELIYAPNEVGDGEYLLNLQIAPFESDATPSRPILWAVI